MGSRCFLSVRPPASLTYFHETALPNLDLILGSHHICLGLQQIPPGLTCSYYILAHLSTVHLRAWAMSAKACRNWVKQFLKELCFLAKN